MASSENEKEDHRLVSKPTSDITSWFTFEEALDSLGTGLYQNLLLLYVGFAWVCDAMEMMLLSFISNAADCEWGLSSAQKGLITSVVFIGMFLGSYIWGMVADNEGRKRGFFGTALFTAIWGFASSLSPNYPTLLVFRALVGFGLGGVCVAFSLFLEFVPTKFRGRYAIVIQGFWTVGALAQAGLAWILLPTLGWRYLLGFSAIPLVILLLFYPLLAESPRFLMIKDKTDKAEEVLRTMAKWNGSLLPPGRLKGPDKTTSAGDGKHGISDHVSKVIKGMFDEFRELFSSALRLITSLLFLIWFVNALIYYGVVLLTTELQTEDELSTCGEDGKLELEDSDYLEIFIDTSAEIVGFLCGLFLIDSLGRKKTLTLLMFLCSLAWIALPFSSSDVYRTTFLFLARATITGSFNVIYVYTPELFPTSVRAFGLGLCVAWSRLGGLVSPLFSVELVNHGHTTIVEICFACLSLAASLAAILIPVETAGKILQDTIHIEMARNTQEQVSDEEIAPL